MQTPLPLQALGHFDFSHATPSNPAAQVHSPVAISQTPRLEHSVDACAVFAALALSIHAGFD
tara:strand:+ start:256 stop:441 length:186 start_codon:yes stop_codon:yes gene_type:complete